ncbi:hypothetical protein BH10ACT8_BH10ACT8_11250 [soil metagenome]
MSDATWPPPADESTVWQTVELISVDGADRHTKVRPVRLWGKTELVTADGLVYCPCCAELLTTREISRQDNPHKAGLPFRAFGGLVPIPYDDPDYAQ